MSFSTIDRNIFTNKGPSEIWRY